MLKIPENGYVVVKILEEADARIGSFEDYKKEQEELAKKEEKNKRPIAFDDDPDKPKSVAFKEAWDDTKERLADGFNKTKEKYIKTDPETGRTDISGAFNALAGFEIDNSFPSNKFQYKACL